MIKKLLLTGLLLSGFDAFCGTEQLVRDFASYVQSSLKTANNFLLDTIYFDNPYAELEIAKKLVDSEIGYFSSISTEGYNLRIADMYNRIQYCKYQKIIEGGLYDGCKEMAVAISGLKFDNEDINKHCKRTAVCMLKQRRFLKKLL